MTREAYRDALSLFISTARGEMADYYELTPTHNNERELMLKIGEDLYKLDSLLKNQPMPKEGA